MALQGCIHIVRFKCEMKFIIAKVIFFLAIPQNIVMRNCKTCGVFDRSRVNVGEAARYLSACLKGNRLFKISHIQVIVCKRKLH